MAWWSCAYVHASGLLPLVSPLHNKCSTHVRGSSSRPRAFFKLNLCLYVNALNQQLVFVTVRIVYCELVVNCPSKNRQSNCFNKSAFKLSLAWHQHYGNNILAFASIYRGAHIEMVAAPALSSKGPQKIKMSVEAQTEVASVVNDPRKQAERGGNGDNVILIHGRWYDVTSFDHPGGPVALSLGIQRDATALFESYHALSNKELLRSHLKQLEVNEAEQSRLSKLYGMGNVAGFAGQDQDFDFSAAAAELHGASKVSGSTKADPFEVEVKQIAREYLKQEAARRRVSLKDAGKATSGKWAAMLLFTAVFLWSMAPLIRGEWYALLLTPTLAWIYMVNCFHDANHFSLHKSWRVNALVGWLVPWFSQPFFWHLQHTIGHHVYTNLPHKDPDLYHTPALRMSEDSAWHPAHQYQLYYLPYIGSQSNFALTFLQPMFWAFKHYRPDGTSLYNGVVLSRPVSRTRKLQLVSHGIITLLVLFGWPWFVLAGESFLKRLAFTFLPIGVVSMWFMAFSQVS